MRKIILYLGLLVMANVNLHADSKETKFLEGEQYKYILNKAEQLYSKKDMNAALDKMAVEITEKLQDKNPIFVCVLNGAIVPMGQLMTRLDFPLQMDYIHATRYGGKVEGGELKILAKPKTSFENRVVVLVEDIIDTGKTLKSVVDYCYAQGASEVLTASLIDKLGTRTEDGLDKADFVGLEIPNKFIVGFGLDYEEYFRNLDGIYVMPENELF